MPPVKLLEPGLHQRIGPPELQRNDRARTDGFDVRVIWVNLLHSLGHASMPHPQLQELDWLRTARALFLFLLPNVPP